ncbi:MAG: hypothetical protein MHM6MM_004153 [Cercozoa sp. M6MM]
MFRPLKSRKKRTGKGRQSASSSSPQLQVTGNPSPSMLPRQYNNDTEVSEDQETSVKKIVRHSSTIVSGEEEAKNKTKRLRKAAALMLQNNAKSNPSCITADSLALGDVACRLLRQQQQKHSIVGGKTKKKAKVRGHRSFVERLVRRRSTWKTTLSRSSISKRKEGLQKCFEVADWNNRGYLDIVSIEALTLLFHRASAANPLLSTPPSAQEDVDFDSIVIAAAQSFRSLDQDGDLLITEREWHESMMTAWRLQSDERCLELVEEFLELASGMEEAAKLCKTKAANISGLSPRARHLRALSTQSLPKAVKTASA